MARYSTYAADPKLLTARFDSTCGWKGCPNAVRKGDEAMYYPKGKVIYCPTHTRIEWPKFEAAAMDEDFMNGGAW